MIFGQGAVRSLTLQSLMVIESLAMKNLLGVRDSYHLHMPWSNNMYTTEIHHESYVTYK